MFNFSTLLRAILVVLLLTGDIGIQGELDQDGTKAPTVFVVLLARNKEHILPYFLTLFDRLAYPKERMSLFIRSDHNVDQTSIILDEWLIHNQYKYHSCNVKLDRHSRGHYPGDVLGTEWSDDRFNNMIQMKEEALVLARHMWADYIWYLDMDVLMTSSDILYEMINEKKAIVAPMLDSLGAYSNFWESMSEDYWYLSSDDYYSILRRIQEGCFTVPMVHSFVLVDLKRVASNALTFIAENINGYNGPNDDIIIIAISAINSGTDMHICNAKVYGFVPPSLTNEQPLESDYKQLVDIKLRILNKHPPLPLSPLLRKYVPPMPKKDKAGFDEIYLINLARRPERRKRMYRKFDELGLSVKLFEAVDGMQLNESYLRQIGVKQMVGYKDPWGNRDLTYGEIGCFLSHYYIWEDIVNHGYQTALVFEDDSAFNENFRERLSHMMVQANRIDYDFIFLGRKKLNDIEEQWAEGSDTLLHVEYSYWAICYIITLRGAKKLLDGQPLGQLVPSDEYIPMMYNKHPKTEWSEKFPVRDLKAFSVSPLYVHPSHSVDDEGYVSDTEHSPLLEVKDDALPTFETNLEGKRLELGISELAKNEL